MPASPGHDRGGRIVALGVLVLCVVQLLVGAIVPGLEQFEGKAFGARLIAYPVIMLAVPAAWAIARRRQAAVGSESTTPWTAFALIIAPFLIDVTGNSLDLYDSVDWWDDANHFGNWLLLCLGFGLLLRRGLPLLPGWALVSMVTGLGAVLAIAWELAEWYAFIRHGTELDSAYVDTLGDEALGTAGALVAGILVALLRPATSA